MSREPFFGCCVIFFGWLVLSGIDALWLGKSLKRLSKQLLPRLLIANAIGMMATMYLASAVPVGMPEYSLDPYLSGRYRMALTWSTVFLVMLVIKWPFVKAEAGQSVGWWRALGLSLPCISIGYLLVFGASNLIYLNTTQTDTAYVSRLSRASELPAAWIYFVDNQEGVLCRARFGDTTGYVQRLKDKVPMVGEEASSAFIWEKGIGYALHLFSYNWTGSAWNYKPAEQPKAEQLEDFTESFRQEVHVERFSNPADYSGGVRSVLSLREHQGSRYVGDGGGSRLECVSLYEDNYRIYSQSTFRPAYPTNATVLPNGFGYFSIRRRIYIVDLERREITYWRNGVAPCVLLDLPGLTEQQRSSPHSGMHHMVLRSDYSSGW